MNLKLNWSEKVLQLILYDGTERKMRFTRASDEEWELIKEFAQLLKDNPEKAKQLIHDLKVS